MRRRKKTKDKMIYVVEEKDDDGKGIRRRTHCTQSKLELFVLWARKA